MKAFDVIIIGFGKGGKTLAESTKKFAIKVLSATDAVLK